VLAEAGGEHAIVATHLVTKADHACAGLPDPGVDDNLVVIAGGEEKAATDLSDRQKDAVRLHIAVTDTAGTA
jgi:hypothetical protein